MSKETKKNSNEQELTPEELVHGIQDACRMLGWEIAMDASNPGIRGIIIGQNTFVENIINQLDDKDNYEIYSNGIIDSLEKH